MPGPTPTGNVLILYGHGALTDATFDFRRAGPALVNIYSWTREGIPVWDSQIKLAASDALASGAIRSSYAAVNSSRVGGTEARDYILAWPEGLALPDIPASYNETDIAALGATAHHNGPTVAASTRILLVIADNNPPVYLSDVLNDPNFNARPFDVLWCACRSG